MKTRLPWAHWGRASNQILYGTSIATKVSVEVDNDIRRQISENSKMSDTILKKLDILDEIQVKLLRIDSVVTSIRQQISEVTNKASNLAQSVTFLSDTINEIKQMGV